ncbi:MAG: hypothetical protein OCD03_08325 [Hyphomicrobiales bacterium]
MTKILKTISLIAALAIVTPAFADLAAGEAAFKAQDYATAKTEFEALPNDASALYLLGLMHMNGMGVDRNPEFGRGLALKSADIGYIPAQMSMGGAYEKGRGVELDLVKAHYYYSLAGRYSSYNQKKADKVAEIMTVEQINEAKELFKKWQ